MRRAGLDSARLHGVNYSSNRNESRMVNLLGKSYRLQLLFPV